MSCSDWTNFNHRLEIICLALRTRTYAIIICLTIFSLSGCLNKEKLLQKNEYLLTNQQVKGTKKVDSGELEAFYRQESNRRLLGLPILPYLWIYYQGTRFYDKEKVKKEITETRNRYEPRIAASEDRPGKQRRLRKRRDRKLDKLQTKLDEGNFLMRVPGEPPVIFDSTLAREAAQQMRTYLFTKGYFDATTRYSFKLDTARKTASVTYNIQENQAYKIGDTTRTTDNQNIDSLLRAEKENSLIVPGENYDEENLNQERERIDKLLKNNGYFNFNRQYVTYDVITDSTYVDSSGTKRPVDADKKIEIRTIINKPVGQPSHRLYRIDDIVFTTDASPSGALNRRTRRIPNAAARNRRDTTTYRGIKYLSLDPDDYSKKILDTKVIIRPGELYSLQKTIETQRILSGLDIFKFANVYYDTTGNQFTARINTSPIERFTLSDEWGVTVSQQLPGPFVDLTFKWRNVFGGLEVFETSVRAGIVGQSGVTDQQGAYASQEVSADASLIFPQILFPGPLRFKFNRYAPRTRLQIGYNFTNRPEYRRLNLRGLMNYTFQKDQKHSFILAPVDVNLIRTPFLDSAFNATLSDLERRGSTLRKSFQTSFVSSISATYTYNDVLSETTAQRHYLRTLAEAGGTTLNIIDWTTPSFRNDSIDGLQLFRYFKLNADFRYYLPMGAKSSWAFRVNAGVARPYGQTTVLPYEKFFFVGGPNSIRAWPARRLGPGSDRDSLRADGEVDYGNNYSFEEPGDILLEASAEYRFDIVSFLEGAFFVDAGNVWVWKSQLNKPQGQFEFDSFFKEIAVGTGFGIRLDFSFLILRLDLGIKAYDPGKPPGEKFMLKNITWQRPFGDRQQTVVNIGIGYPF